MKNKNTKEKKEFNPINFSIASIILLFSAILVASFSEFTTYVRVILLISSGIICTFQIAFLHKVKHTIQRLLEISTKAINVSEEMKAVADASSVLSKEIVQLLVKPYSHEALKKFCLSIETIYIHYVDVNRINDYYRDVIGPVIPSRIVSEQAENIGNVKTINASSTLSTPINVGVEASNEESKTKSFKTTQEGKYIDESINQKILFWQSLLIQNDKIHIGPNLCKLTIEEKQKASNESKKSLDEVDEEVINLMSLNGFVLIQGSFRINIDKENPSYFELSVEHQINQLFEEANMFFNIRFPIADIPNIVFENSYKDKKQLSAIVIGFITPNQFDGDLSNQPSLINVLPIVVYSTPIQPSELDLQENYTKVLSRKNQKLQQQEDKLVEEKKLLSELLAEQEATIAEQEAIVAEKKAIISEKEAIIAEKEAAINNKQNTK